jgi:F-type H+-transporting ATPase subunit a
MEHELWTTEILNKALAGPAAALLNAAGIKHDPAHPWSNYVSMELLVALLLVMLFAILRSQLSVDRPGKLQHVFEVVAEFLDAQAKEIIGHDAPKFRVFFGTMFFFILFMNLIGVIPGFESPTMFTAVPLGLALLTFFFYNFQGIRTHGLAYVKQFAGPIWWLIPIMLIIETISHFARPLSLTVRLYANMFAGEQVFLTFLNLTKFIIPAIFIALHIFVGVLQAYIFTLLGMIYTGSAVSHEEH